MFRRDFFGFFGPDNLHDDNPLTEFALPPVDVVCVCGTAYAERGDTLCAACVADVEKTVDGCVRHAGEYLAKHAAFAEWCEANGRS